MVLPIVKLGSFFVRIISKPVADGLKKTAASNPKFRGVIIDLAQGCHRLKREMARFYFGDSTVKKIRRFNEEEAVEAATNLLGELFVFSVPGLAVVYELQRSAKADAKKEELFKKRSEKMKQENEAVSALLQGFSAELKLLKQKLEQLDQFARQRNMYKYWRGYETTEKFKP